MIVVEVADNQQCLELDRAWFTSLAEHALREENISSANISVALVDNRTIHRLNCQFLQHDYPTDVVTFPLSEPGEELRGELVISTEYAVQESANYDWPPQLETGLYLVHGLLHLCGYDDRTLEMKAAMTDRQRQILRRFLQMRGEPSDYPDLQRPESQQHVEREQCL